MSFFLCLRFILVVGTTRALHSECVQSHLFTHFFDAAELSGQFNVMADDMLNLCKKCTGCLSYLLQYIIYINTQLCDGA